MNLTRKLILFWVATLSSACAVMLVSGALTIGKLANEQQQMRIARILDEVSAELQQPSHLHDFDNWLPHLLRLHDVFSFKLMQGDESLFQYQQNGEIEEVKTKHYQLPLQLEKAYQVEISAVHPFLQLHIPWLPLLFLALGLALIAYGAWRGSARIRAHLAGVELLSKRSARIINNDLSTGQGSPLERPQLASQALDHLLIELEDARQERTRFDKFIRSNTFLDMETGMGNRLFFDNRLESVLKDSEQGDSGVVYLMQLRELERIYDEIGEDAAKEVVSDFSQILQQSLQRYPEAVLARRSEADFAIMVSNIGTKELEELANRLIKSANKLVLPGLIDQEHFLHVGVVLYHFGDEPYQVLSEADMALRAAQLQGPNGWFMYDRKIIERGQALGSVRWRTLLENAIRKRAFVMFTQAAVQAQVSRVHHNEILTRVRDERGQLVSAGVFLPMAQRCGLLPRIDRIIVEKLLKLMEYERSGIERCSINLSTDALMDKEFMRWFNMVLLEHRQLANRLILEVSEYHINTHLNELQKPLSELKSLGCQLLVDHVGRTVVSSHYVELLKVDYLKLHQSIVRNIPQRTENQLFIRSLLGSIGDNDVKVFALGVESEEEWRLLRNLGVFGGQGHYFSESLEKVAECTS